MIFYTYLWLRTDGSPYYAGKGCGNRAVNGRHGIHGPTDRSRILIFPMQNEAEAFEFETYLIAHYGRKDNGTGILRNMTDGGDGMAGHIQSAETRRKRATTQLGNKRGLGNKSRTGQVVPLSQRAQHSKFMKGVPKSEAHCRNISLGRLGKKFPRKATTLGDF